MRDNVIQNVRKSGTKRGNFISRKPKPGKGFSQDKNSHVEQVLLLQRTFGNRAVNRLIRAGTIQAKLTIGKPGDIYEKEADRMADRVMSMPETSLTQRKSTCPECPERKEIQARSLTEQITPLVQRKAEEEEEAFLQSRAVSGQTPNVSPNIESNINSMKGGGQPLSKSTRAFFEPRFGTDFSHVRIHTDPRATQAALAVNANAFTVGNHIVFGRGQYTPSTKNGQRLIAHELTHLIQQDTALHRNSRTRPDLKIIQRAAPAAAAGVTIGAVAARCIIGAIIGAIFDAGLQTLFYSWRNRTFRFWEVTLNYCNIILSAILGCIAAPISAYILEPWIAARIGARLGGIAGTLIGKILLFIAKKIGMAIPKSIVGTLLKLNCISREQAAELGVSE